MSDCILGEHAQGNGYARTVTNAGRRLAHRVAWEEKRGPIPAGYQIHHRCETKACINVAHMELLTIEEHTSLHHPGPKCSHPERRPGWRGRTYCPVCERGWRQNAAARQREKRRLKYQADPVHRAKILEANRRWRAERANV